MKEYHIIVIPSSLRDLSDGLTYRAASVPQLRVFPEPGALRSMVHRHWAFASVQQGLCAWGFPLSGYSHPPLSWTMES